VPDDLVRPALDDCAATDQDDRDRERRSEGRVELGPSATDDHQRAGDNGQDRHRRP
jgi:hypothetical protein